MASKKFTVELGQEAQNEFNELSVKHQRQVRNRILALEEDPRPRGTRKIADHKDGPVLRIRSGDYRIVFQVRDDVLVVLVIAIGLRRDIYGLLKRRLKG